jgi:hypothetical protein
MNCLATYLAGNKNTNLETLQVCGIEKKTRDSVSWDSPF